ncbi:glycosyltransferase [Synechocystis sp. B12]|nr:glycosyltransferase [Synechocystis sp. B12]
MSMPRLSLCMIVQNEAAFLGDCLASVASLVDEIVIADTGSIDNTVEIATQAGAKVITVPWQDDFALARNQP